ncbi:hypothetical protein DID88_005866 [Monilinia fructigena]|uniref:NAD-dependent epimerase/dehydratase domain-containing protein n=1 Tax=Monilinia fructigena TaxID=38457 RepID=A0A395J271_9HELO|nr:hypothetical protein DID88_005866 [Monilinia fructigena]
MLVSNDKFMQADASKEQSLPRIFDRANGKQWDYVFNCGGETRYSQEDEVYKVRSLALSIAVGKEAAKRGVKAFVELSTGMAEEELTKIKGLNLIIVRLAHVYGDYASQFVPTALTMALNINDTCKALWAVAEWYAISGKPNWDVKSMGEIPTFNVVDKGETSQGTIAELIGEIFGIKTGFQGQLVSSFAKLNMDSVVDDINEEVLVPGLIFLRRRVLHDLALLHHSWKRNC